MLNILGYEGDQKQMRLKDYVKKLAAKRKSIRKKSGSYSERSTVKSNRSSSSSDIDYLKSIGGPDNNRTPIFREILLWAEIWNINDSLKSS